jgi:protein-serine/threonine kinase
VYICNLTEVVDVQRVDLKPFCVEVETKEKLLYFAFRTDEEVYGWMEDIYSRSPLMGVSQPTNFVHQVHVGFDPVSGGFTVGVFDVRRIPDANVLGTPCIVVKTLNIVCHHQRRSRRPSRSGH